MNHTHWGPYAAEKCFLPHASRLKGYRLLGDSESNEEVEGLKLLIVLVSCSLVECGCTLGRNRMSVKSETHYEQLWRFPKLKNRLLSYYIETRTFVRRSRTSDASPCAWHSNFRRCSVYCKFPQHQSSILFERLGIQCRPFSLLTFIQRNARLNSKLQVNVVMAQRSRGRKETLGGKKATKLILFCYNWLCLIATVNWQVLRQQEASQKI